MNKEAIKNEFVIFVRTKQFLQFRLRGAENQTSVNIGKSDVVDFFKARDCFNNLLLQELITEKKIIIHSHSENEYTYYSYEATEPGTVNLNLITQKGRELDNITAQMMNYLKRTGLKANSESTFYFDTFLKFKDVYTRIFFTVDKFAGRVYTPVSNFHRHLRHNLLIDNEQTTSLDVATMQPLLLGKILYSKIGINEYSEWINSGADIYVMLQQKANLQTRDKAKKRFFEILFSKPSDELSKMFGSADWINWINEFKGAEIPKNPHNKHKVHSNLAWLLQNTEVSIMRSVWELLIKNNIPFLSIHDEIVIKKNDEHRAKALFDEVLKANFQYYKLNCKEVPEAPPEPIMQDTIINKITDIQAQSVWNIQELEFFFSNIKLPTEPIKFNEYSIIKNVSVFIDCHLATIKFNNGKKTFLPYLERLQDLKKLLEKINLN
ncbi:MAG: hypothetical protein PHT69_04435 [Bacteroidales bacterium]|nr:hypothetical protein [Bacteroidales bacterium]